MTLEKLATVETIDLKANHNVEVTLWNDGELEIEIDDTTIHDALVTAFVRKEDVKKLQAFLNKHLKEKAETA